MKDLIQMVTEIADTSVALAALVIISVAVLSRGSKRLDALDSKLDRIIYLLSPKD